MELKKYMYSCVMRVVERIIFTVFGFVAKNKQRGRGRGRNCCKMPWNYIFFANVGDLKAEHERAQSTCRSIYGFSIKKQR